MRRILAVVLSTLLLTLIACSAPGNPPKAYASNSVVEKDTNEITVYVTKTGEKYHRGTCRYLRQSKIAIPLSEAKRLYDPCSVCRPPT